MQPDTLIPDEFNPQGWNRYAYVLNDPVHFNDPSGNKPNPPPDGRDYDDCWIKTGKGNYVHNVMCQVHAFEPEHQITKIKIKILLPVQLLPGIFILMAGDTNEEDNSEDNKSTSLHIGKTPPFNPVKLKKVVNNLQEEGVDFDISPEARQALRCTGNEGAYQPRPGGRPGVISLFPNPSEASVVEELTHLGQDRNSGWTLFDQMKKDGSLLGRLEMAVQQKLLKVAEILKWPLK